MSVEMSVKMVPGKERVNIQCNWRSHSLLVCSVLTNIAHEVIQSPVSLLTQPGLQYLVSSPGLHLSLTSPALRNFLPQAEQE